MGFAIGDQLRQRRLDIHVHIFQRSIPTEIARLDLRLDHGQRRFDLFVLFLCQDTGRDQRCERCRRWALRVCAACMSGA